MTHCTSWSGASVTSASSSEDDSSDATTDCGAGQYYSTSTSGCVTCSTCTAGQYISAPCGSRNDTQCGTCGGNTLTGDGSGMSCTCLPNYSPPQSTPGDLADNIVTTQDCVFTDECPTGQAAYSPTGSTSEGSYTGCTACTASMCQGSTPRMSSPYGGAAYAPPGCFHFCNTTAGYSCRTPYHLDPAPAFSHLYQHCNPQMCLANPGGHVSPMITISSEAGYGLAVGSCALPSIVYIPNAVEQMCHWCSGCSASSEVMVGMSASGFSGIDFSTTATGPRCRPDAPDWPTASCPTATSPFCNCAPEDGRYIRSSDNHCSSCTDYGATCTGCNVTHCTSWGGPSLSLLTGNIGNDQT